MIDLRVVVRSLLLSDPAISIVVGGTRIYPTVLPQGVKLPSIVQNIISEGIGYHMQGDDALMEARVQLDAIAPTADETTRLAALVFDKLTGYRGLTPYGASSPQLICDVQAVFHDQGRPESWEASAAMYMRARDYLFWYRVR